MAIPVQMPIVLRDGTGASSTRMLQVSDSIIEVEGETTRLQGQQLEFQFSMVGLARTLSGTAVVEKVIDPEFGRGRCTLRITELPKEQRGTFRSWLYDLTQGGGRAPIGDLTSSTSSSPHARSSLETSMRQSSTTLASGGGRQPHKGREALRGALSQYASHREPKRGPVPTARERKRHRVEVRVAASAAPPVVMVRFNDPSRYVRHYRASLHRQALELRYVESGLAQDMSVRVRIVLPGGAQVSCPGQVTAASASAFAVALDLSPSDRATLEMSAAR